MFCELYPRFTLTEGGLTATYWRVGMKFYRQVYSFADPPDYSPPVKEVSRVQYALALLVAHEKRVDKQ